MGERADRISGPVPAPVACPRCGGVARREGIRMEENRAACPHCGHTLDLSAPAAGASGAVSAVSLPSHLSCPKCGAAVTEDSIEVLNALARCRHCTTVLDLSSGRNADWYRRRMEEKEGIPLPSTFRVTRSLGGVTVEWMAFRHRLRQYTRVAGSGGLFRRLLLGVLLLLVVGTVAAFVVPDERIGIAVRIGWLVLLLPVLPMMTLRRRVAVVGGEIRTGWGPLLSVWRTVPKGDLRQVFVVLREIDADDGVNNPEVEKLIAFDLMALGPDGKRFRLLGPFAEREEAIFLERWLERRLGMAERHVDGEMLLPGTGPHS